MIHIGLFEGIGGFSLAARWSGWETYATCEINPFGQQSLKYHFPNAYHHSDIKTLTYETINAELSRRYGNGWRNEPVIITGGFPCQPFSLAGKRKGTEDDRHLWPEMLRIIREVKPEWIVGENVFGIINWSEGMVFEQVQAELEAEGYEVQAYVLPACAVNAPHRRDRVWFVAYSTVQGRKEWEQDRGRTNKEKNGTRMEFWDKRFSNNGIITDTGLLGQEERQEQTVGFEQLCKEQDAADTESKQSERMRPEQREFSEQEQGEFRGRNSEIGDRDAIDTDCNKRCQRWMYEAKPRQAERHISTCNSRIDRCTTWDNFPTQSPVRLRNDGVSYRLVGITVSKHRNESIKAAGNAIVPQVALQIFNAINEYIKL